MDKIIRFQKKMVELQLSAAVLRLTENIVLFSQYWPRNGMSFIVIPSEGAPLLIVPHIDEAAARLGGIKEVDVFGWSRLTDGNPHDTIYKLLQQAAMKMNLGTDASIGIEWGFEMASPALCSGEMLLPGEKTRQTITKAFKTSNLVSIDACLDEIRAIKNEEDTIKLQLVNEVAKAALYKFERSIVPGVSEIELACQIEADTSLLASGYKGAVYGRAWAQVLSGERTAIGYFPGNVSLKRKIELGDFVMVELAVVVDGYWSDLTRTYVCGSPTELQHKMLETTKRAQLAAIERVRSGVSASLIDQYAREIIEADGMGSYFIHHTGHGVGFRYHEPIPFIAPQSSDILKEGMVITIEPGIYIPGTGGVRFEDNVIVTDTGGCILGE